MNLTGAPDKRPAATARRAWKRALNGVVGAAFRLHHYRFVRTRMLHDALCAAHCNGRDARRC